MSDRDPDGDPVAADDPIEVAEYVKTSVDLELGEALEDGTAVARRGYGSIARFVFGEEEEYDDDGSLSSR